MTKRATAPATMPRMMAPTLGISPPRRPTAVARDASVPRSVRALTRRIQHGLVPEAVEQPDLVVEVRAEGAVGRDEAALTRRQHRDALDAVLAHVHRLHPRAAVLR